MEKKWFFDCIPFFNYKYQESVATATHKIESKNEQNNFPKTILIVEGKFQQADVKNENDRIYSRNTLNTAIQSTATTTKLKNRGMLCELEHPKDGQTQLFRVCGLVLSLLLKEDGEVFGRSEIFDTPNGLIISELVRRNALFGVSSRGKGTSQIDNGIEYVNPDFMLETFDFVYSPSTAGAYPKGSWQDAAKTESAKRNTLDYQNLDKLMLLSSRTTGLMGQVFARTITHRGFSEAIKDIEKSLLQIERSDSALVRICESIQGMILEAQKMPMDDKQSSVVGVVDTMAKEDAVPEIAPNELDKGWDNVKEDEPDDVANVTKSGDIDTDKKSERKKRWESLRSKIKRKAEGKKPKTEDEEPNKSIADKDVAGVEEDDDDELEKDLPTDNTSLDRVKAENKKLRKENAQLRSKNNAHVKLNEGLTERCKKLLQANKTLALRYESSVEFAAGIVERVERARKDQYIKESIAKFPALENMRSMLEACKTVVEVQNFVTKATTSLQSNKRQVMKENSISFSDLEKNSPKVLTEENHKVTPENHFAQGLIRRNKNWK